MDITEIEFEDPTFHVETSYMVSLSRFLLKIL